MSALAALGVSLAMLLGACADASPAPSEEPPPSSSEAAPTETAAPPPALVPGGTAAENLEYFESVGHATVAALGNPGGRDFIDALIAAGFDRAAMQVTEDLDTLGDPRTLIEFSVRMSDACLVGQWGQDRLTVHEMPVLADGACLVGATRPIDW